MSRFNAWGKTWSPKSLIFSLVLVASGLMVASDTRAAAIKARCQGSGAPTSDGSNVAKKEFAVISISSKTVRLQVGKPVDNPFGRTAECTHSETLMNPLGSKVAQKANVTSNDVVEVQNAIRQFKTQAFELGLGSRTFVTISGAVASWEKVDDLAKAIRDAQGLPVEIISSRQEAELAIEAVVPDPIQGNNIVHIDLGSGSIKISVNNHNHMRKESSLNTSSFTGISGLVKAARAMAQETGVSIEEAAARQVEDLRNDLLNLIDATPAIRNRGIVVLTGGVPFVSTLFQPANRGGWISIDKNHVKDFIVKARAKTMESFVEDLGDGDRSFVKNTFTLDQIQMGARLLSLFSDQVFLSNQKLFIPINQNSWEMAFGLKAIK